MKKRWQRSVEGDIKIFSNSDEFHKQHLWLNMVTK